MAKQIFNDDIGIEKTGKTLYVKKIVNVDYNNAYNILLGNGDFVSVSSFVTKEVNGTVLSLTVSNLETNTLKISSGNADNLLLSNGTAIAKTAVVVGSALKASALTNAYTIAVSGGAIGTVSYGTSNTNLNIESINASYVKGVLSYDNIPKRAAFVLKTVANDTARFALTSEDVQNGDSVKVTSTGKMYVVIDDTSLNTEGGYLEYTAGYASTSGYATSAGYASTAGYASFASASTYANNASSLGGIKASSYAYIDSITNGTIIAKSAVNATNAASLGGSASSLYALSAKIMDGSIKAGSATNAESLGGKIASSYAYIDNITNGTIIAKSAVNATNAASLGGNAPSYYDHIIKASTAITFTTKTNITSAILSTYDIIVINVNTTGNILLLDATLGFIENKYYTFYVQQVLSGTSTLYFTGIYSNYDGFRISTSDSPSSCYKIDIMNVSSLGKIVANVTYIKSL